MDPSALESESDFVTMGNDRERMRRRGLPPFLRIDHKIFDNGDFKSLSSSAKVVYMCIRRKENGFNANKIICPYSFFQENGIASGSTIHKALTELDTAGFIDIVSKGGLFQQPNIYSLANRWKNRT